MGTGRTDEFRKDAVRIALTSGFRGVRLPTILGSAGPLAHLCIFGQLTV